MIRKITINLLLSTFLFGFLVSGLALGQEEKSIPGYQVIYESMVPMEHALRSRFDEARVSSGYIPELGSIFVCEVQAQIEEIDEQLQEIVKTFGPLLQIDSEENVYVLVKYGTQSKKEQYLIVTSRADVLNTHRWHVFNSQASITEQPVRTVKNITPRKAYSLIQSYQHGCPCRGNFFILDVRTQKEYAEGHIKGSINIDYYSDTFKQELKKLNRDSTYLVYCRSGHRSAKASQMMKKLGFRRVYNMLGGIIQWEKEGFPLIK